MKRVKTKHKNAQKKKMIHEATNEAIGYMLPIFYVALKDELHVSVEDIRRVKDRIDRYSWYISEGLISFNDIKKDLRKAGFDVW